MCGINGFNWKDESLVLRMNEATKHRGPDGSGVWTDDGISLGHNRLAIIDLDPRASQPMHSSDGRYVIIFNGEIYNYKELKKELVDYHYKTESDTEVILAAYTKWGTNSFSRLNGIFSFVIWDNQEQCLTMVRDPMGIKPLYYYEKNGKYIFSSEIKAILEHSIPRELNMEAFRSYIYALYVPGPETLFKNISALPPGSFMEISNEKKNFYEYKYDQRQSFVGDAILNTRNTIEQAVKRQLVSDRPVGIFLSGGIDSSIITDCAVRAQEKINTFSVGFELPDKKIAEKFNHDFLLARQTAKHYGTTHHELLLDYNNLPKLIEEIVHYQDHPIANATMIPTMLLSEMAKKHVAVVLTGDGGDELFGGYDRYRMAKIAGLYQKVPSAIRSFFSNSNERLSALNTPLGIDLFSRISFQKEKSINSILAYPIDRPTDKYSKYFSSGDNFLDQFLLADRSTWLIDEALMRIDHMSMSRGLEARVPLLDLEVVALADKISAHKKIGIFQTKVILKNAFRDRLPSYLFNQPKRGWFTPAAKWLRGPEMLRFVKDILSPDYCAETRDLFKWQGVNKMLDEHISAENYNLNLLWALLVFQIWAKHFELRVN